MLVSHIWPLADLCNNKKVQWYQEILVKSEEVYENR